MGRFKLAILAVEIAKVSQGRNTEHAGRHIACVENC
jgi:hypothetical protein